MDERELLGTAAFGLRDRPDGRRAVKDKVMSAREVAAQIPDGAVVGLQGGPTQCAPMALVRELVRQRRVGLHAVVLSAGIAVDWLVAASCLSRLTFAAVGMESYGLCRAFRRAVESGALEVEELSETALFARVAAAARGLPFLPTRAMIGTDLLAVGNDALRVIDDPFGGPPVVACRALPLDVALLHAHRADRYGNIAVDPMPPSPAMTSFPRAAQQVYVSVEEIVDTDELRRHPERTILPAFSVAGVVEARYGAHPTSLFPRYDHDAELFRSWVGAAASAGSAQDFLDRYVRAPVDHAGYVEVVGGAGRLAALAIDDRGVGR